MKLSPEIFRVLGLCTQRPDAPVVVARLPAALASVVAVSRAGRCRRGPRARAAAVRAPSQRRIRGRFGRVGSSRGRASCSTATPLTCGCGSSARRPASSNAPVCLCSCSRAPRSRSSSTLNPRLRPMRDVDLLIRGPDATRAVQALARCGFGRAAAPVPPDHHHLPPMMRIDQGVTITIELHHRLLAPTPLIAPVGYDDLVTSSQAFDCGGRQYRTLGCEDMLWHVYAHAFVINTLRPGAIRLLSVADLVHATEAWIDRVDWAALRRRYPRLMGALSVLPGLVPWSESAAAALKSAGAPTSAAIAAQPMDGDIEFSRALVPGILWPGEWWFRMRYGVSGLRSWILVSDRWTPGTSGAGSGASCGGSNQSPRNGASRSLTPARIAAGCCRAVCASFRPSRKLNELNARAN